jgi:polyhydroxybutyrate depolymerase
LLVAVVSAVVSAVALASCALRPGPSSSVAQPKPAAQAVLRSAPGWVTSVHSFRLGGYDRSYLLARPTEAGADRLPLVVILHGRNMTPTAMASVSGFLGLQGHAILVYPAGVGESWNAGYCCGPAHSQNVDDVSFVEAVVHQVLSSYSDVAARDVYLVGYSNGGRMALRLACADPGAFAGVAAVEAVAVSACARTESVPLLEVGSTGDPLLTIPHDAPPKHIAGHTEMTVAQLLARWRSLDDCAATSTSRQVGRLILTQWTSCRGSGRIEFAEYQGGSHQWPRGGPGTPSAERVIWDFFRGASGPVAAR